MRADRLRFAGIHRNLETAVPASFADIATCLLKRPCRSLEEIVSKLEKSSVSLDDSVKLYERGDALKKRCDALLAQAEARIEKITLGANGAPKGVGPLDAE